MQLSLSEKRWIISFLVPSGVFGIFMALNCLIDPINCGVGLVFGLALYAPMALILSKIGLSVGGVGLLLGGPVLYALTGWLIGATLKKNIQPWRVTISVALLITSILIYAGNAAAFSLGLYG